MSSLGNYSKPDYWPMHRTRDAGAVVDFRLIRSDGHGVLGGSHYGQTAWVMSSSRLSSFRVYPRKSDPG